MAASRHSSDHHAVRESNKISDYVMSRKYLTYGGCFLYGSILSDVKTRTGELKDRNITVRNFLHQSNNLNLDLYYFTTNFFLICK